MRSLTAFETIVRGAFAATVVCTPVMTLAAEGKSGAVAAMAESLLNEGKKLLAERQVPEACRKIESSYRIDPAPGTLLTLAMCHEQEGKLVTAWGEFNESLQLAKKDKRADRVKIAREHMSAIEPLMSRFVVVVPEDAAKIGMIVEMDGVPVEEGAWGTAIPIDAGDHKAVVRAPKYKSWEKLVAVEHGKVATVIVPKLEQIAKPVPQDAGGRWKKPAGFAALGVSAVLLGIGGYFGVQALTLGGEVNAECEELVCNAATWKKIEDGRNAALAANFLIGFGIAAAGAGTFFLITAPRTSPEPPAAAFFRISVTPERQFLGIGGTF
jgi:hypothetical protein